MQIAVRFCKGITYNACTGLVRISRFVNVTIKGLYIVNLFSHVLLSLSQALYFIKTGGSVNREYYHVQICMLAEIIKIAAQWCSYYRLYHSLHMHIDVLSYHIKHQD